MDTLSHKYDTMSKRVNTIYEYIMDVIKHDMTVKGKTWNTNGYTMHKYDTMSKRVNTIYEYIMDVIKHDMTVKGKTLNTNGYNIAHVLHLDKKDEYNIRIYK